VRLPRAPISVFRLHSFGQQLPSRVLHPAPISRLPVLTRPDPAPRKTFQACTGKRSPVLQSTAPQAASAKRRESQGPGEGHSGVGSMNRMAALLLAVHLRGSHCCPGHGGRHIHQPPQIHILRTSPRPPLPSPLSPRLPSPLAPSPLAPLPPSPLLLFPDWCSPLVCNATATPFCLRKQGARVWEHTGVGGTGTPQGQHRGVQLSRVGRH